MKDASRRSFLSGVATGALAGAVNFGAGETAAAAPIEGKPYPDSRAFPTVQFGKTKITRLVLGGNPFGGYSHSVQKISDLMREYFTVPRITDLIMHAEEEGITTMETHYAPNVDAGLRAARDRGSRMQWICLSHAGEDSMLKDIVALKPIGIAHHGNRTDDYFHAGNRQIVLDYVKKIHDLGIFAGVSSHCPKHIAIIEDSGWENDFYMTCLYYLTRTQDELRLIYGDTLVNEREEPFVKGDPERMTAVIRSVKKPCLAFKLLAAGRNCISPERIEDCFKFAYSHIKPIDAAIVGMYPVLNDEVRINCDLARKYSRQV